MRRGRTQLRSFDLKSALIGIIATVVSGLILAGILGALSFISSKNPKTEARVEYFPFILPPEFSNLEKSFDRPYAFLKQLKTSDSSIDITEDTLNTIFNMLSSNEIIKFQTVSSVFYLVISNSGNQSEKDIRFIVKDTVAYYKKIERNLLRANQDKDGYVTLPQINPGETFEFLAFSSSPFYSTPYSTLFFEEKIRAFSSLGTIPLSFYTLKPSLISQLTTDFFPLFLWALSTLITIIAIIVWQFANNRERAKAGNRIDDSGSPEAGE